MSAVLDARRTFANEVCFLAAVVQPLSTTTGSGLQLVKPEGSSEFETLVNVVKYSIQELCLNGV